MSSLALKSWTREEYLTALNRGVLNEDARLELLDGQIVTKMPQNAPHSACVSIISEWLNGVQPDQVHVRVQLPIALSDRSEPEPDVAVVGGTPRDYMSEQPEPRDVRLLIEVADTSLQDDQRLKGPLYAEAGISDYWILDLTGRRMIVHSMPEHRDYGLVRILHESDEIAPPFAPSHSIKLSELLP